MHEMTFLQFSSHAPRTHKLEIFSDEVKAEFGISLSKDLTEHVNACMPENCCFVSAFTFLEVQQEITPLSEHEILQN